MFIPESIGLPLPTDATSQGPKIQLDGSNLYVRYDYHGVAGTTEWAELLFCEVLYFAYRNNTCFTKEYVMASEEMKCFEESKLLTDITTLWTESVGWQEFQVKHGGASRFRHYRMYFDHDGSIDIVASSLRVG